MVVFAAAVVSKGGKPLLSRQFIGLPRSRVESLLSSFPRLVSPSSEHTVVEASGVRFVYAPLETLYVLLITNTQSNILLDLSTLGLVTRIVTDLASGGRGGQIGEVDVLRVSFDVLGAWDEVVTLGYREHVTLAQVRTTLEMESHEEKIQEIIARNKEQEAKEELKRRAKQLELQRREMVRRGQNPYAPMGGSNSSGGFGSGNNAPTRAAYQPAAQSPPSRYDEPVVSAAGAQGKPFKTKGMQLGSKKARNESHLAEALGGLDISPLPVREQQQQQQQQQVAYDPPPVSSSPAPPLGQSQSKKDANPFGAVDELDVHLTLREKMTVELSRDGGVSSLAVAGSLDLRVKDAQYAQVVVALPVPSGKVGKNEIQFKTHPNVDKKAWTEKGEVRLKEGKKLPVGTGVGVLKWRLTGKDETSIPVTINCWPSTENGTSTINLEYELTSALSGLVISLPMPRGASPVLSEPPSHGTVNVNDSTGALDWIVGDVSPEDGTENGTLELTVEGVEDEAEFWPLEVGFVAQRGVCGVEIKDVKVVTDAGEAVSAAAQDEWAYSVDELLSSDGFTVV